MNDQDLALFRTVEIEVNSRCNRRCVYCPVSTLPISEVSRLIEPALFGRIVQELKRLGFNGTLSYHFYNEPLLHPKLESLVWLVASELPSVFQLLYTNGDLLDDRRYSKLTAAGISYFIVTRHDDSEFPERPRQKVLMSGDLILTNRGGFMTNVAKLASSLALPCHAPAEMLIITVNGEVLLCCDDAARTQVMGSLLTQPIEEIWFSPEFRRKRDLLRKGRRRDASPICAGCTNREYVTANHDHYSTLVTEQRARMSHQHQGPLETESHD